MKNLLYLSIILIFVSCGNQKKIPKKNNDNQKIKITVSGVAQYNTTYCGGAKPTPQIISQHEKLREIKNSTIRFKKENDTQFIEVITDAKGNFKIDLEPGTWEYYIAEDFKKNQDEAIMNLPDKCDKFYNISYGEFTTKTNITINLMFHLKCNPCDSNINNRQ